MSDVYEKTSAELGDILVTHLTEGIDGTDIRAGFIGEIGTERGHITAHEERVFRAAARASVATGAPIWTHTTHFGELAVEQIDLLEDAGVDPSTIVVNHLGDREDTSGLLEIAKRGVYLSIDNIGYTGEGYPSDDVRVRSVMALAEAGYLDKTVLGTDIGTRAALRSYGGRGFAWLIENFVPRLRASGLNQSAIDALTTDNVASALTIRPVAKRFEAPVAFRDLDGAPSLAGSIGTSSGSATRRADLRGHRCSPRNWQERGGNTRRPRRRGALCRHREHRRRRRIDPGRQR